MPADNDQFSVLRDQPSMIGAPVLLIADDWSPSTELRFAGLVAIAGGPNPIPFRTRPLNSPAPMILSLKAWESRSLPGLPSAAIQSSSRNLLFHTSFSTPPFGAAFCFRVLANAET